MDSPHTRNMLYGTGSNSGGYGGEQGTRRVIDVGAYTRGAADSDVYRPAAPRANGDQGYYLPYANGLPKHGAAIEIQPATEPPRWHQAPAAPGAPGTNSSDTSTPVPRAPQHASWLVPDRRHHYWSLWTVTFTLAASFAFAFMAGQYGFFALQTGTATKEAADGQGASTLQPAAQSWGPASLGQWLVFWRQSSDMVFDFKYLLAWGGRWAPSIADGQWWRMFSSIILHSSFTHLLTNMLVFLVVAVPLEHVYGPFRVLLIFVASGLAANFLSMAFEDPCSMYVGASGAVFGFISMYLTDTIINWETIVLPVLRLGSMLVVVALMLVMEYVASPFMPAVSKISHLSHIGGLLAGLFLSFLFLPDFKDRRWRRARRAAKRLTGREWSQRTQPLPLPPGQELPQRSCWGRNPAAYWLVWLLCACVVLFFFAALPVYIWRYQLPSVTCPGLDA